MTDTAEKIILKMPKLGESIQEATVLEWLKKEGDPVKRDEPLLEVTTDKVNSEIPASISGFIVEIYAKPGEVVEVGAPLCALSSEQVVAEKISSSPQASAPPVSYSPAVLRLAGERGIPLEEIALITGTGEGGRITKRDIEAYNFAAPHYAPPLNCASSRQKAEQISGDMLPLSPLRKIIADRMVQSVREIPHAALVSEVDMGEVMQEIGRKKEALWKAEGVKLTPTSFVIEAIAYALKFYPHLNASLVGETIVLKKEIHVGVAVSKNDGVLVPVIPQVEKKDVVEIARVLNQKVAAVREEKAPASDFEGGTITLTNFGMGGAMIGVPIIRQPEVAIVGLGTIEKRVVATAEGHIAIRPVAYLSLSFDHRVVDGIYASGFLAKIKEWLEKRRCNRS